MKNVYERMKEENAQYKIASFRAKQKMTYFETQMSIWEISPQ